MTSTVQIIIQFNGKQLTIPINPESITINRSASNSDIDIVGLGKATRKGEPRSKRFIYRKLFSWS